ncbi:MAG: aspartate/glutamate racemase family protein [Prolixibacteraceae bacterium]|nr:aspartate/glutamate racemase family protein [Prolixibacteraceae bacterium]
MKTIGLIGGMSWESTQDYYRIINNEVNKRLGGLHSAKSILYSVDFAEIEHLQRKGDWTKLTKMMIEAAQSLERAGAGMVVICTNTMHKMADEVQAAIGIPLINLADATGESVIAKYLNTVGLLGTKFTMEQDFYKGRLAQKYGLKVIVPDDKGRELVHKVIYEELCLGKIKDSSRAQFLEVIDNLIKSGAQGIVLGCTEIPMLVKQKDVPVPVFDTTAIHAKYAVDLALSK